MGSQAVVIIPYDIAMQFLENKMPKIPHKSEDWGNELVLILDGEATYYYNDKPFKVSKGDIFVLNGDYTKYIDNVRHLRMCSIYYHEKSLRRKTGTFRRLEGYQQLFIHNPAHGLYGCGYILHADEDTLSDLAVIIQRMSIERKLREPGFEQILNSYFLILITQISRAFAASENFVKNTVESFYSTIAYMEANYTLQLRLNDLARMSHLSERQFNRRFKELYNTTPGQHMIQLKLGRACILLEETDMTVSEIALECGFSDINYFSKVFKSVYNQAPTSYRKTRHQAAEVAGKHRHSPENTKW